jgi:DNA-binding HxlR family transcriptional regulator
LHIVFEFLDSLSFGQKVSSEVTVSMVTHAAGISAVSMMLFATTFFMHIISPVASLSKVKYLNYQVYSEKVTMQKESKPKQRVAEHLQACPVRGIIDVISKKWAFLIINALGNHGRLRFNSLMTQLEGISPKTLSDTLKTLKKEKLVKKEAFNEIPPRVEYSLTDNGKELRKAISPLIQWAAKRSKTENERCTLKCQDTAGNT